VKKKNRLTTGQACQPGQDHEGASARDALQRASGTSKRRLEREHGSWSTSFDIRTEGTIDEVQVSAITEKSCGEHEIKAQEEAERSKTKRRASTKENCRLGSKRMSENETGSTLPATKTPSFLAHA